MIFSKVSNYQAGENELILTGLVAVKYKSDHYR